MSIRAKAVGDTFVITPEDAPIGIGIDRTEAATLYAALADFLLTVEPAKAATALTIHDVMTAIDARIAEWLDWSRIDRTIEDKVCDKYRQARLEILDGDRVGINFRPNGRQELPAADIVQAALRGEP